MTRAYKRQLAFLFFIAAVVLLAGIGMRGPWPADEPRYALIARDMVDSGSWLIPHVGGVFYPDKPPVFFWTMAVLYALTGSIRVAFLLPGVLAGFGVLCLVTDLARRLWDERAAIWSGATLLALLQFPLQMKAGQIDALLCFWTTLGIYGFCRHLLLGPDWRWYTIGGLACGLGVITKGVGFLPLLMLIPYAIASRRAWRTTGGRWRNPRWWLAPAAMLAGIAVWLVPMLLASIGSTDADLLAYRDNILFRQTITRYADSWGHLRPPWYLFTNAIPWLWLPVTLLLPWLIPAWRRDLGERKTEILLLGGWILLVLLFFSLSSGKRSLYIFPAAPAVALIAGLHASALLERVGPRRALFGLSLTLGVIFVLAAGYLLRTDPAIAAHYVVDPVMLARAPWFILAIGAIILVAVATTRVQRAPLGVAVTLAVVWVGISTTIYPAIDTVRSGKVIIDNVRQVLPKNTSLGFAGWTEQFLLHWNAPAVHFGYRRTDAVAESRDAANWLSRSLNREVLLPNTMIEPCFNPERLVSVGEAHRREWFLADKGAVTDACSSIAEPIGEIVFYHPSQPDTQQISRSSTGIYGRVRVFE